MPTIVIDPGSGAATAAEAAAALDLVRRIRHAIENEQAGGQAAPAVDRYAVHLTHDGGNPDYVQRAAVARRCCADLFLSLDFNRLDSAVHGTGTWIDRKYRSAHHVAAGGRMRAVGEGPGDPGGGIRNLNHVDDSWFAATVARACYEVLRPHDRDARLVAASYDARGFGEDYRPPPGVRMRELAVLDDALLGTMANGCRACLLEIDFLDNPALEALFTDRSGSRFRDRFASGIARALIDSARPRRPRRIPPE